MKSGSYGSFNMLESQSGQFSRRERQIMDIIYARREATVALVRSELPDPPSYSAVRALIRILEEKGHLIHREEKARYIYSPTHPRRDAAKEALKGVLAAFFDNSAGKAAAALLTSPETRLSKQELDHLTALIQKARKKSQGRSRTGA
jgi:predicted transcriptional regulator